MAPSKTVLRDGGAGFLGRRALLLGGVTLGLGGVAASAADVQTIAFDGLYKSFGVTGYVFADRVIQLKGQPVRMTGYMAPPLKAESDFFVLTRQPLAICPFCQSDADWPVDIVVVKLRGASPLVSAGRRIVVTGRLDVGPDTDVATGFVSQIRIVDASFDAA